MVALTKIFRSLKAVNVLVIGDLMLDKYTIGKARRISPEAPVPIVTIHHEELRPGGAGNVMLNLLSLGANVFAVGRVGNDEAGVCLKQELIKEGVAPVGIFVQEGYMTPVKNRIISDNQQIVRIDHEVQTPLEKETEQLVITKIPELLKNVDVIALSDYGKGFLTETLLKNLFKAAKDLGIAVITDPKGVDFSKYKGTTWIKPNLSEAYAAANLPSSASLDAVANKLLMMTHAEIVMITRSEEGISLFSKTDERIDLPVRKREIKDVTGAGDTVLGAVAFGFANGLSVNEVGMLSNVAAGIAIEHFGCARVTLAQIARSLLIEEIQVKLYDEVHLHALAEALKARPFTLLIIPKGTKVTATLFKLIRDAKTKFDLLVYKEEDQEEPGFIEMLTSFNEVDFILQDQVSLNNLCKAVPPQEIFVLENNRLESVSAIEEMRLL